MNNVNASSGAHIEGTDGNDVLVGGAGNDSIWGGAGNDIISSGAGNDYLVGGEGADVFTFEAGDGHDTIADFEVGVDAIEIFGERVNNFADISHSLNQDGQDVLIAINAHQSIRLIDTWVDDLIPANNITGTSGADALSGTAGNDIINGLAGNDVINAGNGDDTISGGTGNDTLRGQSGIDTLVVSGNFADYTITDNGNGSFTIVDNVGTDGTDTLVSIEFVQYADGTVAFAPSDIVDGGVVNLTEGNDAFTGTAGGETINGLGGNDVINAGDGDDIINGGTGNDVLRGQTGTDTLVVSGNFADYTITDNGNGSFTIVDNVGTDGTDTLVSIEFIEYADGIQAFAVTETGGSLVNLTQGNDVFQGSAADEVINGLGGNDVINAGNGDDTISGGTGNDTLRGQSGTDTLVVSGNFADYTITDNGNGSFTIVDNVGTDGTDTLVSIEFIEYADGIQAFAVTETGGSLVNLTQGNDVFQGSAADEIINGLGGNDVINAGDGDDIINGGTGNDVLRGQTGTDTLVVSGNFADYTITDNGNGSFRIADNVGTDGVDTLVSIEFIQYADGTVAFGVSDGVISLSNGNDTFAGTAADDIVNGLDGNDVLGGGAGADQLNGGEGDDILTGGSGGDAFVFTDWFWGDDVITDFTSGVDTLDFLSLGYDISDFDVSQVGNDTLLTSLVEIGQTVLLQNFNAADLTAADFVQGTINGTSGADALSGTAGNDIINGLAGNDVINAGNGDDTISGGTGNDVLRGQSGTDTLVVSGNFADYTITDNGNGSFTIVDNVGTDGTDTLVSIEFVQYADGTVAFAPSDIVDGGVVNLTEGNDAFTGTAGGETINGLGGNDVINAGDGDDIINGGTGNDVLRGQTGTDTLVVSGNFADYTITDNGNGSFTIVDNVGTDGTDTLVSIEFVQYADGTVAFAPSDIVDGGVVNLTEGNDAFTGTAGGETINGLGGNDVINAGDGDDIINGGTGNDVLRGQSGTDTLVVSGNFADYTITDNDNGSFTIVDNVGTDGTDTFVSIEFIQFADGTVALGASNGINNLTDGNDSFEGTARGEIINAFGGDDFIWAGAGDDIISSGAGNDYLVGGEGADVFIFEAGDDHDTIADFEIGVDAIELFGERVNNFSDITGQLIQDGQDVLIAITPDQSIRLVDTWISELIADNVITGTSGADAISGTAGNDIINGLDGNDVINAGDGDDTISGGTGNDTLRGQSGTDTLVVSGNFADYTITDNGNGSFRIVDNVGTDGIDTLVSIEFVQYADGLQAFNALDLITLTDGNDTFVGTAADDVVNSLGGNDVLNGAAGNDVLNGGEGDDILTGGAGDDTFVFTDWIWGDDVITDFTDGEDMLDFLSLGYDFADFEVTQVGNDTLLTSLIEIGQTVLLENFDAADLSEADFI